MLENKFSFELITQSGKARLGIIKTPRGNIDTPAFMPVGTQGSVKGVFLDDILDTNTQIILGNTYHLLLRPNIEILRKFNGLHKFINWPKPILTDSGGYQIMSLSKFNKIDLKLGAIFKSHLDGKKIILSPEKSIQVQKAINSDIMMVLDECPKLTKDKKIISKAIDVSTEWAKRSKVEFLNESTPSNPEFVISNLNELPKRFHMVLNYQIGDGMPGFIVDGPLPFETKLAKTRWVPIFGNDCKNYIMITNRVIGKNKPSKVIFKAKLFNSFNEKPLNSFIVVDLYENKIIRPNQIHKNALDFLRNNHGWLYLEAEKSQSTNIHYASLLGNESIACDHGF